MNRGLLALFVVGAFLFPRAPLEGATLEGAGPTRARRAREPAGFARLDSRTLPRLLKERGFQPPRGFKALVVAIVPVPETGPDAAGEPGAKGGLRFRPFDWRGTSDDRDDWWPASSVKLFAAVAALERVHQLGFPPTTGATYHYDEIRLPLPAPPAPTPGAAPQPPPRAVRTTVEAVVRAALTPSDNQAYDRLVELVGFDRLHRRFLSRRNGLRDTALLRSYAHRVRDPQTGFGTARHSPPITLFDGDRSKRLPEQWGKATPSCPDQGNCSSLRDLAETMRRVMLHEVLPEDERFDLGEAELALLRSALSAPRERGNGVVDGLREAFGRRPVTFHHKPGYAYRWFSDVVLVEAKDTGERWVVAMAAHRNRGVLDAAARQVGALLAEGRLKAAPEPPPTPRGRKSR